MDAIMANIQGKELPMALLLIAAGLVAVAAAPYVVSVWSRRIAESARLDARLTNLREGR
jgi:hypothetical protein